MATLQIHSTDLIAIRAVAHAAGGPKDSRAGIQLSLGDVPLLLGVQAGTRAKQSDGRNNEHANQAVRAPLFKPHMIFREKRTYFMRTQAPRLAIVVRL